MSATLPNFGLLKDNVYENSLSASYTRLTGGIIRETSLNYSISSIPGQGLSRNKGAELSEGSRHATAVHGGYGDTVTHALGAKIALGSDVLDSSLISGIRAGLGMGYEYVAHDAVFDQPEETDKSISAFASLQQQTPLGSVTTSYKYVETASNWYAGYTFSGLELYLKDNQSGDRPASRQLGLKLKLDLDNLGNLFRKTKKSLFRKANFCYKGLGRTRHNGKLNSDQFAARPRILEAFGPTPSVM